MKDLIAKLEAAPEGSRELDAEIAMALGEVYSPYDRVRLYTTDLTAARSLSDWMLLYASDIGADGLAVVRLGDPASSREVVGIHARLEIAWVIAAIKAIEATR